MVLVIEQEILRRQNDYIKNFYYKSGIFSTLDYGIFFDFDNLRDKLRVKEIWVEGAYQYRNPEEDLPQDFSEKKDYYYNLLNKTKVAKYFTRYIKLQIRKHLNDFNAGLPKNNTVQILKKGHIRPGTKDHRFCRHLKGVF